MIVRRLLGLVSSCGARLKYIKNKCKLSYCKIIDTKKDSNKLETTKSKNKRNKYGFPII